MHLAVREISAFYLLAWQEEPSRLPALLADPRSVPTHESLF